MKRLHRRDIAVLLAAIVAVAAPASAGMSGTDMNQHGMGGMMGMGGMGGMGMGGMGMGGMGMGGMGGTPPHMMHYGWFAPGGMAGCFMATGDNGAFPSLDERLNFIHAALMISQDQQSQWQTFAMALKRSQETMQAAYQTMMNNMMNMNFVDRFNTQLNTMNAHMAELQKVAPALAALYGVLTPEQKAKADSLFRSMGCFI